MLEYSIVGLIIFASAFFPAKKLYLKLQPVKNSKCSGCSGCEVMKISVKS